MKQTAVEWLAEQMLHPESHNPYIEQALEMEEEQMQMTWNNAIDAVQKDKWESYDDFYNNNFKSEEELKPTLDKSDKGCACYGSNAIHKCYCK
jgi:hypothetical protein